jgi:two-component system NtrC family sensor kinase
VVSHRLTEVFPGVEEFGLLDALRRVFFTGATEHLPAQFYQDSRISGWRENFVYRLPTKDVVAVYRDVSAEKAADIAMHSALRATEKLIDAAPFALVVVGKDQTIRRANEVAGKILSVEPSTLFGQSWEKFIKSALNGTPQRSTGEAVIVDKSGNNIPVILSVIPAMIDSQEVSINAFLDLTERKRLETELRQAQKLEAIGRLASGIAHEINTPIQFIGDNTYFLQTSFQNLLELIAKYRALVSSTVKDRIVSGLLKEIQKAEEVVDLGYIEKEIPQAISQSLDGVMRVASIVRAMKDFAHPGETAKTASDINHALTNTLTVARNELKYVAEVETEFGDLPLVTCNVTDLNQVFLNLLVNAAHAIKDVVGSSGEKGKIRIRTSRESNQVLVAISDTGSGISEENRSKIFEPFFTTKPVGQGTGQGLALARSIVVEKHGGTLTFESEVGKGTTFLIRLPIGEPTADMVEEGAMQEARQ